METGNQREGYGRSRGKWSRKKEREKQKEQQREHLDLLNPEKETPEKQEEKNAGRKIAVAVGGTVLTAAVAAGAVYVGMGQKYKRVYFPNTTINGLDVSGLTPERDVAPQNAYISNYISGTGYEIVPEEQGASPDPQLLSDAVKNAILNFQENLSLEDAQVYEKPQITAESEALNTELAAWNKYVHTTVTYRFGSRNEVLDGEKIHTWLVSDGQGGVSLDESKIGEYVSWLAQTYNTAYKPKSLKTSYGQTVTISKSVYGWKINQKEETEALKQLLLSCESQEREPVYNGHRTKSSW